MVLGLVQLVVFFNYSQYHQLGNSKFVLNYWSDSLNSKTPHNKFLEVVVVPLLILR